MEAPPGRPGAPVSERVRRPFTVGDLLAMVGFLALAMVVFGPFWRHVGTGYLYNSASDQHMWEWFFASTAHAVVNLDNPLLSPWQNHPLGVNMMANTTMLGLAIPLTPVTIVFGPSVTWAVALTGGLAGTAAGWYWVLSRHVVRSRIGAAVGGAFCGFAPPMISHANAHPNFAVLVLLPFIVLGVVRLLHTTRPVRDGVVLGLLVAYQIFLGEEPLLIGAVTFLIFAVSWLAIRRHEVDLRPRRLAAGLGTAAGVALVIVAFPLWWQFFGPQSYGSIEHGYAGNDAAAFTTFATESWAAQPEAARELSMNRTEENAFFGWPLVILFVVLTVCLWRVAVARAAAIAAFAMCWLSTGVFLIVDGSATAVPGPWLGMFDLPLFESVLESRFALGAVPAIAVLLAVATDRVLAGRRWVWPLWFAALAGALLPIAPTPLEVVRRPETPPFFAQGLWRNYVDPGGTVVPVPLPDSGSVEPLQWQVETGFAFPLPEGYFVGPGTDGKGTYGAPRRPLSRLLEEISEDGTEPVIDEGDRARALADLRYWNADVIVLPAHRYDDQLKAALEAILHKPARVVGNVWMWDVREFTP
ncbi:glycosyl transferase [Amycolatopsis suaedae]|uniref:glycosyl transferase n=1 Tax=Amycolatopsis suaedae TaxID=2510978 RepID=UPI003B839541